MKDELAGRPVRQKKGQPGLGLGLLNWTDHVTALHSKWIMAYLNASDAPWKFALDAWFSRSPMGRGGILTNISIKEFKWRLTMRAGESELPSFWRIALRSIRMLTLIRDKITRESQRPLSLWHNPILPPPPIAHKFKEAWASLGTHTVLDTLDPKTQNRAVLHERMQ
jgi:hypothetical protein